MVGVATVGTVAQIVHVAFVLAGRQLVVLFDVGGVLEFVLVQVGGDVMLLRVVIRGGDQVAAAGVQCRHRAGGEVSVEVVATEFGTVAAVALVGEGRVAGDGGAGGGRRSVRAHRRLPRRTTTTASAVRRRPRRRPLHLGRRLYLRRHVQLQPVSTGVLGRQRCDNLLL